jgi:ATP-dependent RNA helicase SUPV3L1/SUV3
MLDTEIAKTGEVSVEGHVIGRLDGFMFAPDASAAGSEAKALNAAAQKVLSVEIESRATRLSHAPNDQIVLANDGAIRWLGAVVGKLATGDDTLRPRVRIIADEHLNGPARELVQTRLDLWLKSQIEKLLAPLFTLTAAEDVTGMARGIAFQVVEAIGILERQKVAEEVKNLDQPSRATLRKYGVRFGAYHIYVPALMKPAPRALATQLWALKHEAPDAHGVTELLHLAASGRTSIPVDKDTPKALYRTSGYRICGDRAVRVDILERLADLIRPALAWREGSLQPKPDGAVDGRGFTVTGAMTSLTGASGEDFASILRALGYRMERRPKPPEPEKPAEAAPATEAASAAAESASESAPEQAAEAPAEQSVAEPETAQAPVADAEVVPQVEASAETPARTSSEPAAAEGQPEAAEAGETATSETAEAAPAEATTVPVAAEKPQEPELIEVWRPAGRAERRPKPQHQQHQRRPHHPRQQQAAQTEAPAGEGGQPAAAAEAGAQPQRRDRPERDGQSRQDRRDRHDRRERMDKQDTRSNRGERSDRGPRPPRRGRGRDEGPDRAERAQYYARPHGGDRRNKEPDPNSPFAKLAALKQQLEQKEPN